VTTVDVDTPHGLGRASLHTANEPRAGLILGHGAAGGVTSRDLVAAREGALMEHVSVALVEQPYRVAGRKAPAPAHQLDAAWIAVVDRLLASELAELPVVVGGRSLGARVACRTAVAVGAVGVVCIAFPLQPPGRRGPEPRPSRLPELDAVLVPTLVVQGDRDPFGIPPSAANRSVVLVPGTHSPSTDLDQVRTAVQAWLPGVLGQTSDE
jgi:predicted alpha/beta-hydrolase family hydrolase